MFKIIHCVKLVINVDYRLNHGNSILSKGKYWSKGSKRQQIFCVYSNYFRHLHLRYIYSLLLLENISTTSKQVISSKRGIWCCCSEVTLSKLDLVESDIPLTVSQTMNKILCLE